MFIDTCAPLQASEIGGYEDTVMRCKDDNEMRMFISGKKSNTWSQKNPSYFIVKTSFLETGLKTGRFEIVFSSR